MKRRYGSHVCIVDCNPKRHEKLNLLFPSFQSALVEIMAGEPRMVLSAQAKDTDSLMIPSLIVESLTICMCIGLTEDVARIRLDTNGTVLR